MLSCLHATRYTHLQHHRHCLGEGDIEGAGLQGFSAMKQSIKDFSILFFSHRFAWNSNHLHTFVLDEVRDNQHYLFYGIDFISFQNYLFHFFCYATC